MDARIHVGWRGQHKGGKLCSVALAVLVGQEEAHQRRARRKAALQIVVAGDMLREAKVGAKAVGGAVLALVLDREANRTALIAA